MRGKMALAALTLSFAAGGAASQNSKPPSESVTDEADRKRGQAGFEKYCSACHQSDGSGVRRGAPPLAGSRWVAGSESALIRIVLHGLRGPIEVAGEVYSLEMPGFGNILSDEEAALLLTFVRQRWGEPSPPIQTETVRRIRAATPNRIKYWTAEELQE